MILLLVVLVIVGVLLYIFQTLVPMDPRFKNAIIALVCLAAFIYILQAFGLIHGLPTLR